MRLMRAGNYRTQTEDAIESKLRMSPTRLTNITIHRVRAKAFQIGVYSEAQL